ncbi:MAG: hypothetical protein AB7S36_12775 [Planctomycetota bacterium]
MSTGVDAIQLVARHAPQLQTRAWLTAACALAGAGRRCEASLGDVIADAIAHDVPAGELREALLQTMLFGGYPCALNALGVWHREMAAHAPEQLAALPSEPLPWPDDVRERGETNARRVYGRNLDRLLVTARALSPDLAEWMIVEGYGRVLGREALLSFESRELCVVATLVPLDAPRQLFSHIKGCANLGIAHDDIRAVVDLAAGLTGQHDAHTTLREVLG